MAFTLVRSRTIFMCSWNILPRRRVVWSRLSGTQCPCEPRGEQIGEHSALNPPIMTVQDRTDPVNERLDLIHLFVVRVPHVTTFYPIAVHATDSVSGQQPEASAASARKPICERAPLARGAHIRGKCAYLRRGRIHVHRAHRQPVCKLFPRNAASNSLARPDECLLESDRRDR